MYLTVGTSGFSLVYSFNYLDENRRLARPLGED